MRSGTSFFDWTVYKKTIARFWPLWAAYSVLWLIFMPLEGFMYLRLDAANHNGFGGNYMENFATGMVANRAENTVLALAVVFGALAAMAVFSHLYNARSANLFGSLPIRREGLFLTHYLAGLSFMVVPNVVVFLLTLIIEGLGGYVCMEALWFWLAASCGECLFFYSMAVFCGMFTGHILALPAFYAVLNVFAYGVTGLFHTVLNSFYYGFAGFPNGVEQVVIWLTPVLGIGEGVGYSWDGSTDPAGLVLGGWNVLGIYALVALALTAAAFFLYRARRLESAGDVVSVRPMRPVFKYGVAFCVGMVFGMGTSWTIGGGEVVLAVAILVWGVVGYFAAQMLLDKSFRVFRKWKGAVAVAGVFIALFLVVGFDLTGFETRVPNAADVESVDVRGLEALRFSDDGDDIWLNITDPEQIELFVALHRAAVEQRDSGSGSVGIVTVESQTGTSYVETVMSTSYAGASLRLEYRLKNGSTLKRSYYVKMDPAQVDVEGTAAWAVEKLFHMPELYWRVYMFDQLEEKIDEGGRLETAQFSWYDAREDGWGGVGNVIGYGKDARALLDAVEEDLLAGRIGVRTLTDEEHFYTVFPLDALEFQVVDQDNRGYVKSVKIALQDTATSTLAELERLAEEKEAQSLETPQVVKELRERGWVK